MLLILTSLFCLTLLPHSVAVRAEEQSATYPIELYLSTDSNSYRAGSVVNLASTAEPAVNLTIYNGSFKAQVLLYQVDKETILKHLLRDKDNNQINKNIDISSTAQIASQDLDLTGSQPTKVTLPLTESGSWLLRARVLEKNYDFFLTRSEHGVLVKQGNKQLIYWAQNFQSRKSVQAGSLTLYSMLNKQTALTQAAFDKQGIAKTPLLEEADLGVASFGAEEVIFPVNIPLLNSNYSYHHFKDIRETKYFLFTDRKLYKPGDTVYFKAVIRDDYDASYSIPKGVAQVKVTRGYDQEDPLASQQFPISADGTVFGEYKISPDSPTGYYAINMEIPSSQDSGYSEFQVEYYSKPEYSLEISTDKLELVAGDRSFLKVSSEYFFGQPVANKKIKYVIRTGNYYQYQMQSDQNFNLSDDFAYGYWSSGKVQGGEVMLDKKGQAQIDFAAKIPLDKTSQYDYNFDQREGRNQVFSLETLLDDGSGKPAYAKKNILVYAGEFDIFHQESLHSAAAGEQFKLPLILSPHFQGADISRIDLSAQVKRQWWIPKYEPGQKYPTYQKQEEDLTPLSAVTNSEGSATLEFTPPKPGSYTLTVKARDKRGNPVVNSFYLYVTSDKDYYTFRQTDSSVVVSADKDKYSPAETAKLTIFSKIPDTDIFLSLERGYLHRFQVVHVQGNTISLDLPLKDSDIPNMPVKVSSFLNNRLEDDEVNLLVSAQSKKLNVGLTTDRQAYGPGETVEVKLKITDHQGAPVAADATVWAVDKALYELSDQKPEDIFNYFWQTRYNYTSTTYSLEGFGASPGGGGGCFLGPTLILMQDGTQKRIDQVKEGDFVQTRKSASDPTPVFAKVLSVSKNSTDGYLIINGQLKVTANHKIWVADTWKQAGSIQIGDYLIDRRGNKIAVSSLEWQKGKAPVYNLEIEGYRTFFADSTYVHNQKGVERKVFEDTAYWNPAVQTDASGQATLRFKLPDNLTTWVLSSMASTTQTQVGQQRAEVTVKKDVFIRPILPNILRTGDQALLSAIVHNFTDQPQALRAAFNGAKQNLTLKPSESKQIYWTMKAEKEADKEKLVFSLTSADDRLLDSTEVEIPIRAFGWWEKEVNFNQGSVSLPLQLSLNSNPVKTKLTVELSPTILGPAISAMKYLFSYPYGCVEQTVSRLVPALISKQNPQLFGSAPEKEKIDQIIKDGLKRLQILQQPDGGFGWWKFDTASHFLSAYAVENLLTARDLGFTVSRDMLKWAEDFLEAEDVYDADTNERKSINEADHVARAYGLALLGSKEGQARISSFEGLTPDIMALAVLANLKNGYQDPQQNGFSVLLSESKPQGEMTYFEGGAKENFGSPEASTALAVRAMIAQGLKAEEIVPYVRFLVRGGKNIFFNTFASSQTIKALSEYAKISQETKPNFSYSIVIDDKTLTQGSFIDLQTLSREEILEIGNLKTDTPHQVRISQSGAGRLYSTATLEQFITGGEITVKNEGLEIQREYLGEKGAARKFKVGDIITVRLTVSGLGTDDFYAIIHDELPAGFSPINASFENEQFFINNLEDQPQPSPTPSPYEWTEQEVTENGMILSIPFMKAGPHVYTYQARAISQGIFKAPPSRVELMYNPNFNGRSAFDTVEVSGVSRWEAYQRVIIVLAVVLAVAITVILYFYAAKIKRKA